LAAVAAGPAQFGLAVGRSALVASPAGPAARPGRLVALSFSPDHSGSGWQLAASAARGFAPAGSGFVVARFAGPARLSVRQPSAPIGGSRLPVAGPTAALVGPDRPCHFGPIVAAAARPADRIVWPVAVDRFASVGMLAGRPGRPVSTAGPAAIAGPAAARLVAPFVGRPWRSPAVPSPTHPPGSTGRRACSAHSPGRPPSEPGRASRAAAGPSSWPGQPATCSACSTRVAVDSLAGDSRPVPATV